MQKNLLSCHVEPINEEYILIHREMGNDSLYQVSTKKEVFHAKRIKQKNYEQNTVLFVIEDLGFGYELQYYINLKGQIISYIFNTQYIKNFDENEKEKLKQEIQNCHQSKEKEQLELKRLIAWKGQEE